MEGDTFANLGNGNQVDNKVLQTFQKNFVQVQNILDQNRLLINEINQNQESKIPDNLSRNVGLIRELNSNIRRVVDLYADLSSSFTQSMETSSAGDSGGKSGQKRIRLIPSLLGSKETAVHDSLTLCLCGGGDNVHFCKGLQSCSASGVFVKMLCNNWRKQL
ncbi:hypothetical protein HHK36_014374 [Tetracentron sinense]|uniref:Protein EARLY FLOWERING 4 domain-containing protein n=1 Tax=Tetracentron sinense TaxID=13715 RepID=A0A835DFB9_TETSI|nr:hypothetical protein HHK36_014374 [Tetracentron sinense]